jgi:hypothetical protein
VEGIQVHPESILTPGGSALLQRFLAVERPRAASSLRPPEKISKN